MCGRMHAGGVMLLWELCGADLDDGNDHAEDAQRASKNLNHQHLAEHGRVLCVSERTC